MNRDLTSSDVDTEGASRRCTGHAAVADGSRSSYLDHASPTGQGFSPESAVDPSRQASMLKQAARPEAPRKGATGAKAELVLKKLRLARGATIVQIMEATGWQAHLVRGFLSAVVRKKLGLNLVSEIGKDGQRRYRIIDSGGGAAGEPS